MGWTPELIVWTLPEGHALPSHTAIAWHSETHFEALWCTLGDIWTQTGEYDVNTGAYDLVPGTERLLVPRSEITGWNPGWNAGGPGAGWLTFEWVGTNPDGTVTFSVRVHGTNT